MSAELQQGWRLDELAPVEPGIVCMDIDRMVRFYTGVLGLELVNDAQTIADTSTRFGTTPHGYRIVRLQTQRGQKIKLVQAKIPPQRNTLPQWVYERQGLAYLTFVVADIETVVAQLKKRGVRTVSESVVEVRPGIRAIYTLDPEENYLEFIEYSSQQNA